MYELIVNPVAGNGLAKETAEKAIALLKEKGAEFSVSYTERAGHASELAAAAAANGVDTVLSFGGDGTISEIVKGLSGTRTALGIIPCGTGNDFIKAAKLPSDWKEALEFILTHKARPINCGVMNDTYFINVAGAGFDVLTLDMAEKAKKHVKGIWPYLYGVLKAITVFKPYRMHIEIDDAVFDGDYLIISFGNGQYIGGGIPITPLADLTDGLFEVLLVDAIPRWKIPFYLPSLMMGTLYKKKIAHRYQAVKGCICMKDMRLNLDGEILSVDKAEFACVKDGLLLHW